MTDHQNKIDARTLLQKVRKSLGVQDSPTVSTEKTESSSATIHQLLPLNSLWNRLHDVWQQGNDRPITSHRKGMGSVIVGLKKIMKPVIEFPMTHRFQAQRDMETIMMQMMGALKENMDTMAEDIQRIAKAYDSLPMQQLQSELSNLNTHLQQMDSRLTGEMHDHQKVQEAALSKLEPLEKSIDSLQQDIVQIQEKKKDTDNYFYTHIVNIKQELDQFNQFRETAAQQLADIKTTVDLNRQHHEKFNEQFAGCWNEIQKLIAQYNEINKSNEFSQQIQSVFERMFQFHEKSLKQLQDMDIRLDEINYRVDNFFMTLDKKSLDLELQLEKLRNTAKPEALR